MRRAVRVQGHAARARWGRGGSRVQGLRQTPRRRGRAPPRAYGRQFERGPVRTPVALNGRHPVPASDTLWGASVALLPITSWPARPPKPIARIATSMKQVALGGRFVPQVLPVTMKSGLGVTPVIAASAPPSFRTVMRCDALAEPTMRSPKPTVVGEILRTGIGSF